MSALCCDLEICAGLTALCCCAKSCPRFFNFIGSLFIALALALMAAGLGSHAWSLERANNAEIGLWQQCYK